VCALCVDGPMHAKFFMCFAWLIVPPFVSRGVGDLSMGLAASLLE
jgi:hypothetical protein